jgi:hypothetical protein
VTTDESATPASSQESGETRHPGMVRVKVRVRRSRRRRRRLIALVVLLLAVVVVVALGLMARSLLSARHEALAAQHDLTAAKDAISHDRIGEARSYVAQARGHVDRAHGDADGLAGDVWAKIPVAGQAVDDERNLIGALDETTSVAELGVEIYPIVSGHSAALVRGQRIDMKLLQEVVDRTSAIGGHIDQALSDLDRVQGNSPIVGDSVDRAKTTALNYLAPLQATYETNEPIIRSLPTLVGAKGPRTYLLAMLNPAEQRYSGGGALSFTSMRFDHGVATFGHSVNIEDVNAQGYRQSWTPVTGNTFHRSPSLPVPSSTFSPWWSVSGEELLRGYQQAFPGTRYAGVIAIDLQGLARLFSITGPINLPSFGQITADNLVKTLGGSYGNFSTIAERHRLNEELVPAFRQKFFEGGNMSAKVKSLAHSAQGRHFITYFRNPHLQRRFLRLGLSGNLSATKHDYIGVFSQNLNGSKTDYWQHREVTSTVHLLPTGKAQIHLHVSVTNGAPPYALPGADPQFGYATRYLSTRIGVFLPRHAEVESTALNGKPWHPIVHLPDVPTVRNRKYVEGQMLLNSGQTQTLDVSYEARQAAQVSGSTMTYYLDIDPQDLVTPEIVHVTVVWPKGYRLDGALPTGWKATSTGATYTGSAASITSWAIPLTKG